MFIPSNSTSPDAITVYEEDDARYVFSNVYSGPSCFFADRPIRTVSETSGGHFSLWSFTRMFDIRRALPHDRTAKESNGSVGLIP
jgi:hypothetical protein